MSLEIFSVGVEFVNEVGHVGRLVEVDLVPRQEGFSPTSSSARSDAEVVSLEGLQVKCVKLGNRSSTNLEKKCAQTKIYCKLLGLPYFLIL